ncbi:hypothetical protein KFL_003390120 [Klebsormidium nitens]|uniref:SET domain-containing protein n=1 Tax=Klebsormidium nitens TaxID=105231 RepID=A0A1Y1IB84_KLENI|nr:hypothetical protein KFL_003390120 [Klebsormidium nitens]|eukprot:GAQ87222.1 hypothetical protein KFL_003390120 [Klebsormidium nitens]
MRRQLQALWDSKVQALLHAAFQRVGVSAAPSWHDWVWSHVVVWSRLLEWPAPTPDGTPDDNMQEGLLPFIDFCNHASASPVVRVAVDDAMVLVAAAPLPPATQVCISYGDKSNEELLFLYGFALPANPHDRLLLHAPPSALEPFGALPERLALLRSRGLSLRWLLPDLDEEPQAAVHSWQAALAAARVVTMPAAEAEQAAAQEERADMSPVEAPVGEVAASSDAAETAHEDAVRWLAELLKARLRALDGADEPEDVAGAGWGSLRDEDEIEKGEADGPGTGGMRAAQGVEAGSDIRAGYCDYYRASERRLCEDYLDLASQLLEPTPFVMDR